MEKKGFTFIEILVVTVLIGVLAAIGIVSFSGINKKARDGKRKSDVEQIRSALEMYRSDNGYYPTTGSLVSGISPGTDPYINDMPETPETGDCTTGSNSYENCYEASPTGCDNTSTYCYGYEIGIPLEVGSSYVKQNP